MDQGPREADDVVGYLFSATALETIYLITLQSYHIRHHRYEQGSTFPLHTALSISEMAQDSSSTSILDQLKSSEQDELMTAINELRGQHIRRDLDLPQIIVCGNQSSGKSSGLEAITRVAFPTGTGTTTLFASELLYVMVNTKAEGRSLSHRRMRTTKREATSPNFSRLSNMPKTSPMCWQQRKGA